MDKERMIEILSRRGINSSYGFDGRYRWLNRDSADEAKKKAELVYDMRAYDASFNKFAEYIVNDIKLTNNIATIATKKEKEEMVKSCINCKYYCAVTTRCAGCNDFCGYPHWESNLPKKTIEIDMKPLIKDVIFNPPATIVFWTDGTKTIVKAANEEYDAEKGLAMAISKKMLGNKYEYYNTFKHWLKRAPGYKKTKE